MDNNPLAILATNVERSTQVKVRTFSSEFIRYLLTVPSVLQWYALIPLTVIYQKLTHYDGSRWLHNSG